MLCPDFTKLCFIELFITAVVTLPICNRTTAESPRLQLSLQRTFVSVGLKFHVPEGVLDKDMSTSAILFFLSYCHHPTQSLIISCKLEMQTRIILLRRKIINFFWSDDCT